MWNGASTAVAVPRLPTVPRTPAAHVSFQSLLVASAVVGWTRKFDAGVVGLPSTNVAGTRPGAPTNEHCASTVAGATSWLNAIRTG